MQGTLLQLESPVLLFGLLYKHGRQQEQQQSINMYVDDQQPQWLQPKVVNSIN